MITLVLSERETHVVREVLLGKARLIRDTIAELEQEGASSLTLAMARDNLAVVLSVLAKLEE